MFVSYDHIFFTVNLTTVNFSKTRRCGFWCRYSLLEFQSIAILNSLDCGHLMADLCFNVFWIHSSIPSKPSKISSQLRMTVWQFALCSLCSLLKVYIFFVLYLEAKEQIIYSYNIYNCKEASAVSYCRWTRGLVVSTTAHKYAWISSLLEYIFFKLGLALRNFDFRAD